MVLAEGIVGMGPGSLEVLGKGLGPVSGSRGVVVMGGKEPRGGASGVEKVEVGSSGGRVEAEGSPEEGGISGGGVEGLVRLGLDMN